MFMTSSYNALIWWVQLLMMFLIFMLIFQCLFCLTVSYLCFLYFSLFLFLFSAGSKSEGLTFHADPNYDPTQGKIYFVYASEQ